MEEALKIIGAVLGSLGFLLSCVNLWRSIKTDKRARSLTIDQKRQELRNIALQGKIAILNARMRFEEVASEAESQGAARLFEQVQIRLNYEISKMSNLDAVMLDVANDPPPEATYDEVLKALNVSIGRLNEMVNPALVEAETGEFINLIKRCLEARKLAIERGADPDEVENTLLQFTDQSGAGVRARLSANAQGQRRLRP